MRISDWSSDVCSSDLPDPDRGWALSALTGGFDFPAVKGSTVRNLLMQRVDPVLFTLSRDYVGDTAETASLLWHGPEEATAPPQVSEAVDALAHLTRLSPMGALPALLDRPDAAGRIGLPKTADPKRGEEGKGRAL